MIYRQTIFWGLFRPSKRLLSTYQVEIDYDNENIDYYDDNCVDIDDYGDENNLKPDKYHGLLVKMYP